MEPLSFLAVSEMVEKAALARSSKEDLIEQLGEDYARWFDMIAAAAILFDDFDASRFDLAASWSAVIATHRSLTNSAAESDFFVSVSVYLGFKNRQQEAAGAAILAGYAYSLLQ